MNESQIMDRMFIFKVLQASKYNSMHLSGQNW